MPFFFNKHSLTMHVCGVGVLRLEVTDAKPPYPFKGGVNTEKIIDSFMEIVEQLKTQVEPTP